MFIVQMHSNHNISQTVGHTFSHQEISVSEVKAKIITNALNHSISQIVAVECHSHDFNIAATLLPLRDEKVATIFKVNGSRKVRIGY